MKVFYAFDNVWKQCQIIFKYRCERTHPAWNIMNSIFNTNFTSPIEIRDALRAILRIRNQYPELVYRRNWIDVFNHCVSMIRILDDVT